MLCPNCQKSGGRCFYEVSAPVLCSFLFSDRSQALKAPMGDIQLVYCEHCEFVYNRSFQPQAIVYDSSYEETQGYSPTFTKFLQRLAEELVARFDLKEKKVLEIGCGKGQFLETLVKLGVGQGIGFDPAFVEGRLDPAVKNQVKIFNSLYSEQNRDLLVDFVACRHTLEHIPEPLNFMKMLRRNLGEQNSPLFIEVPNFDVILRHQRFWDIYYEHCSYFNESSLRGLLQRAGFSPVRLWADYDDQYLLAIGTPQPGKTSQRLETPEKGQPTIWEKIQSFTQKLAEQMERWQKRFEEWEKQRQTVALWGSGSKAVSFLANLKYPDCLRQVVDINPHKRGKYMPNFSYPILAPEDLKRAPPGVVIVMNDIYFKEIEEMLENMGISPLVLSLE